MVETPWPRELIKGIVYLSLGFQGNYSPSWQGGLVPGGDGAGAESRGSHLQTCTGNRSELETVKAL